MKDNFFCSKRKGLGNGSSRKRKPLCKYFAKTRKRKLTSQQLNPEAVNFVIVLYQEFSSSLHHYLLYSYTSPLININISVSSPEGYFQQVGGSFVLFKHVGGVACSFQKLGKSCSSEDIFVKSANKIANVDKG